MPPGYDLWEETLTEYPDGILPLYITAPEEIASYTGEYHWPILDQSSRLPLDDNTMVYLRAIPESEGGKGILGDYRLCFEDIHTGQVRETAIG